VSQQDATQALARNYGIDEYGDDLAWRKVAKPQDPVVSVGNEQNAPLNGRQIPSGSPVREPALDYLR
jgi:hypothetical protein